MAGPLYVGFHLISVKEDKDTTGIISFTLEGFEPKKHSSNVNLNAGTLTVTATKGPSNYRTEIPELKISEATHKPKSGKIDVHVKKTEKFNLTDAINRL